MRNDPYVNAPRTVLLTWQVSYLILAMSIWDYDTSETTTELIGDRLAAKVTTLVKKCDR